MRKSKCAASQNNYLVLQAICMYLTGELLSYSTSLSLKRLEGVRGLSHPASSSCLKSCYLCPHRIRNGMESKWCHVLAGSQWSFDLFNLCTLIQGGHLMRVLPTICVLEVLQYQPGLHFLYLFYNLPGF